MLLLLLHACIISKSEIRPKNFLKRNYRYSIIQNVRYLPKVSFLFDAFTCVCTKLLHVVHNLVTWRSSCCVSKMNILLSVDMAINQWLYNVLLDSCTLHSVSLLTLLDDAMSCAMMVQGHTITL